MKILVTGGMGFIGCNFIRNYLNNHSSDKIINVDKLGVGSNTQSLKDLEKNENYKYIKMDITDENVDKIVNKCDIVINFAAETHVDRSISDPKLFIRNNIMGTFNLLEIERKMDNGVKHIQVSTDEVYGDIVSGSFSENDRLKPSNPYSASKASSDLICQSFHRTYGMDIRITRCTNNYGPYQFPEKLIPKTIISSLLNLPIPIYGTGKNRREWLFVLDHCSAIEMILQKGKPGEIYNISSMNEITNIDLVSKIIELMGRPQSLITFVEDRPGHDIRYSLTAEKIQNLGWKPAYKLETALQATIDWYLKNESWWRPLATSAILSATPWKK
jgi:dTDP-glucose 4,6-dehydratase